MKTSVIRSIVFLYIFLNLCTSVSSQNEYYSEGFLSRTMKETRIENLKDLSETELLNILIKKIEELSGDKFLKTPKLTFSTEFEFQKELKAGLLQVSNRKSLNFYLSTFIKSEFDIESFIQKFIFQYHPFIILSDDSAVIYDDANPLFKILSVLNCLSNLILIQNCHTDQSNFNDIFDSKNMLFQSAAGILSGSFLYQFSFSGDFIETPYTTTEMAGKYLSPIDQYLLGDYVEQMNKLTDILINQFLGNPTQTVSQIVDNILLDNPKRNYYHTSDLFPLKNIDYQLSKIIKKANAKMFNLPYLERRLIKLIDTSFPDVAYEGNFTLVNKEETLSFFGFAFEKNIVENYFHLNVTGENKAKAALDIVQKNENILAAFVKKDKLFFCIGETKRSKKEILGLLIDMAKHYKISFSQTNLKLYDIKTDPEFYENTFQYESEKVKSYSFNDNIFLSKPDDKIRVATNFYGPDPKANAIREFLFMMTKAFVEGTGRKLTWTSGHREGKGNINHQKGAFDYRSNRNLTSNERHIEASELSKYLYAQGAKESIVIVEELFLAPNVQGEFHLLLAGRTVVLTSYQNGEVISTEFRPQKNPEQVTHTHVGIRKSATVETVFKELQLTEVEGSKERISSLVSVPIIRSNTFPKWDLTITKESFAAALLGALASGQGLVYNLNNGTYAGRPLYSFGSFSSTSLGSTVSLPNLNITGGGGGLRMNTIRIMPTGFSINPGFKSGFSGGRLP